MIDDAAPLLVALRRGRQAREGLGEHTLGLGLGIAHIGLQVLRDLQLAQQLGLEPLPCSLVDDELVDLAQAVEACHGDVRPARARLSASEHTYLEATI